MSLTAFVIAVLGLLLTPGPTNTLMALAGAERGFFRATRLIPAEVAGYLITTLPLAIAGGWWIEQVPLARPAIALVAAVWVMWLALCMWRLPAALGDVPGVGAGQVLVTTLLNPKALIFGLVLLPPAQGLALRAGLFAGLILGVAVIWIALGAAIRRTGSVGLPAPVRRGAAVWLGILSMLLAARAVAG